MKNVQQLKAVVDLRVIKDERPFNGPINNCYLKRVASASKFILTIKNNNKENGKINLITPVMNVLIRFFYQLPVFRDTILWCFQHVLMKNFAD